VLAALFVTRFADPSEMDSYLVERDVEALAAFMGTPRDPNYVRPPD